MSAPAPAGASWTPTVLMCAVYGVVILGMIFYAVFFEIKRLRRQIERLETDQRSEGKHAAELLQIRLRGISEICAARHDGDAERLSRAEKRLADLARRARARRIRRRA